MAVFYYLHDDQTRWICTRPDGRPYIGSAGSIDLAAMPDRRVIAAVGDDGGPVIVVEAEAGLIPPPEELPDTKRSGSDDGDAEPEASRPEASRLRGLRLQSYERRSLLLRDGPEGRFMRIDGDEILFDAENESQASSVHLVAGATPFADGLLRLIPPHCNFDAVGLSQLLSGDLGLLPVVKAVLPQITALQARGAWAHTPRTSSRDAYHELIREHGRERISRFSRYTAEFFAIQIEAFGWSIGRKTYGAPMIMESGRGQLTIGRYCSMADPHIILGNHGTRAASSYPFLDLWVEWPGASADLMGHTAHDVVIGNDVWIGVNATILPGSTIGDGAVIGAGTVVRGKIPPYAVCIGNPHQVIRRRFDDFTIERLLRIKWWDWSDGMVDRYLPLILAPATSHFLDEAEKELGLPPLVPGESAPADPPQIPTRLRS